MLDSLSRALIALGRRLGFRPEPGPTPADVPAVSGWGRWRPGGGFRGLETRPPWGSSGR